jgi:vacuolar protein-sorting-associated protein 4
MERAESLKEFLANQKKKQAVIVGAAPRNTKTKKSGGGGSGGDGKDDHDDDEDPEKSRLRSNIESAILREKPNVRWEDVAGLQNAKESLKEAVILPMKFPHLFTGIITF